MRAWERSGLASALFRLTSPLLLLSLLVVFCRAETDGDGVELQSFADIPVDSWTEIGRHLSLRDFVRLTSSSARIHQLLLRDPSPVLAQRWLTQHKPMQILRGMCTRVDVSEDQVERVLVELMGSADALMRMVNAHSPVPVLLEMFRWLTEANIALSVCYARVSQVRGWENLQVRWPAAVRGWLRTMQKEAQLGTTWRPASEFDPILLWRFPGWRDVLKRDLDTFLQLAQYLYVDRHFRLPHHLPYAPIADQVTVLALQDLYAWYQEDRVTRSRDFGSSLVCELMVRLQTASCQDSPELVPLLQWLQTLGFPKIHLWQMHMDRAFSDLEGSPEISSSDAQLNLALMTARFPLLPQMQRLGMARTAYIVAYRSRNPIWIPPTSFLYQLLTLLVHTEVPVPHTSAIGGVRWMVHLQLLRSARVMMERVTAARSSEETLEELKAWFQFTDGSIPFPSQVLQFLRKPQPAPSSLWHALGLNQDDQPRRMYRKEMLLLNEALDECGFLDALQKFR